MLIFAGKNDTDLGMLVQTVKEPPVLTADLAELPSKSGSDQKKVVLRLLTMAGQSVVGDVFFKRADNVNRTVLPKIEKQLAKCNQFTQASSACLIPLQFVVTTKF